MNREPDRTTDPKERKTRCTTQFGIIASPAGSPNSGTSQAVKSHGMQSEFLERIPALLTCWN
jgi:hypothetical protein